MRALIGRASGRATFAFVRRNEGSRLRVESGEGELVMAEEKTAVLPAGTDKIIAGASEGGGTVTAETTLVSEREIPAPKGDAERPVTGSGSPETGLADRLRSSREKLANQAGDKARGLVS